MNINDFLARLHKVRQTGQDRWIACCPVHKDDNPSLSITLGRDSRILIKCQACGAGFREIVDAIGLNPADLMGDAARHGTASTPISARPLSPFEQKVGRLVCEYPYRDIDGVILFIKERRIRPDGKKTFMQKVPADPATGRKWEYGHITDKLHAAGKQKPLYRLPEIRRAIEVDKPIWFVEGEKDVDNLVARGLEATTTSDGAGGGWQPYYADFFAGASMVYIVPDNDPPPPDLSGKPKKGKAGKVGWQGQKFAALKLEKLRDRTPPIPCKVVELPQVYAGNHVKDVTDFLVAGGTVEELQLLAQNAPDNWEPPYFSVDYIKRIKAAQRLPRPETNAADTRVLPVSSAKEEPIPVNDANAPWNDNRLPLEDRIEALRDHLLDALEKGASLRNAVAALYVASVKSLRNQHRIDIASSLTIAWLIRNGQIFYNAELQDFTSSMYFRAADKTMIDLSSDLFSSWLSRSTGLNRQDTAFKRVTAEVENEALQGERSQGVIPERYWASRPGAVYISNGKGQITKITAEGASIVDNGTDGILFQSDMTFKPWKLTSTPRDPFAACDIWAKAEVSEHDRLMIKLWTMVLPFNNKSKPILCCTGGPGSGKTTIIRGLFALLGTEERSITIEAGDKGEAAFWPSVNQGGLILADNVDTTIPWFSNAIEAASTGGSREQKKLYSDADIYRLKSRAAIAITSIKSLFASSMASADRTIFINVSRRQDKETKESELYDQIEAIRDDGLTYIADAISRALADTAPVVNYNRRHSDFGRQAIRIARAIGMEAEATGALKAVEAYKYIQNIKSSPIGQLIMATIRSPVNLTALQLLQAFENSLGKETVATGKWSAIKIGRSIGSIEDSLRVCYDLRKVAGKDCTTYCFTPTPEILAASTDESSAAAALDPATPLFQQELHGTNNPQAKESTDEYVSGEDLPDPFDAL